MAEQKKRCGKCACCRKVACKSCSDDALGPRLPPDTKKKRGAPNPFAHSTPFETMLASDFGSKHASVHREFAEEAAKDGNVALAHNEAKSAAYGQQISESASNHLRDQLAADAKRPPDQSLCCLRGECGNRDCPLRDFKEYSKQTDANAERARGDAKAASDAAKAAGPNPNRPGTPSDPSPRGYPGGPKNPFHQNPNVRIT